MEYHIFSSRKDTHDETTLRFLKALDHLHGKNGKDGLIENCKEAPTDAS